MDEKSIHSLLQVNLKEVLLERIESSVNTGTADCNACYHGAEFWMEYKVVGHKSKSTTVRVDTTLGPIWLRPAQNAWHLNRAAHLSKAFVVGRTLSEIVVLKMTSTGRWVQLFVTKKPFDYNGLLNCLVAGF